MASRNRIRVSTARPSAHHSSATPAPNRIAAVELPPYKKPSHPLDMEATRLLRELQGGTLSDIKRHNDQATTTITGTAECVNDILREHGDYFKRRQKKWDVGHGLDDKDEEERTMRELQEKVDEATAKLEESMRAVIDSGVATDRIDETLGWLRQNAPRQLEEEYNTQITQRATQRQSQSQAETRRRRTQDTDGDGAEEEEDIEAATPGPTPLDGSRVALTGASELFISRMQHEKDAYTSHSYIARYARHNKYRNFKRLVHDAKYGDSGPPLGHEDTWFTETGSPAPGITDGTQRGAFDDDDDIMVDKASISTRCPITYQQFEEPYSSDKCPHTFEKNAILDMIRASAVRVGGGGQRGLGEKAVACPVPGCSQMLTKDDLSSDVLLIRKIKRMLREEANEAEESPDEEAVRAPQRGSQQVRSSGLSQSSQRPPNSTAVEDLGTPSDSD